MSSNPTRGFAYWRAIFEEGAEIAVDAFLGHLKQRGGVDNPAVFPYLPSRDALIEAFRQAERSRKPLRGIPFAVKDTFDVAGWPTRAGSAFFEEVKDPITEDAALVHDTRALGAVPVGKTQLNEFAYGLSGRNDHFGDCPHPSIPHGAPGGSSSASAWAVGSGVVPLAIGTDTGGSIRVPASWCGLYGLRVPRRDWSNSGMFNLAPSFDTVGWLTNTPEDMMMVSENLLGRGATRLGKRLKVLSLLQHSGNFDPELREALEELDSYLDVASEPESAAYLGFNLVGSDYAYTILTSYEAASVHADWLGPYQERYGKRVYQRIERGRHWPAQELELANKKKNAVTQAFKDVFLNYDAVLIPAVPTPTPPLKMVNEPVRNRILQLNAPASLARLPVLTVPIRLADGRSGGLQVIFPGMVRMRFSEVLSLFYGNES